MNEKYLEDFRTAYGRSFDGGVDWLRVFIKPYNRLLYFGRIYESAKNPIKRFVAKLFVDQACRRLDSCMQFGNNLGGGVMFAHCHGITVPRDVKAKGHLCLFKGCTIGHVRSGNRHGWPQLGDRVVIGINATVVGGIRIGNNVLIAPNAFVNFDVPDNSVVVGNPGVIHHCDDPCSVYLGQEVA